MGNCPGNTRAQYILGGQSSSSISGEKTENNRGFSGSSDYWVVKLDNLGNIQWDKTIGGNDYDWLHSLQQTTDRGYILGGHSVSNISGEKTENRRGGEDYWVVKLSNLGNIQWDKTIGGSSDDFIYSLQQTSDGGYILGGSSYSNISGEKTENNRGVNTDDYWLVKLNRQGNIQWDKTIGGNDYDQLNYLQQTSDGGLILGGSSLSNISDEKTENSRGNYDYWVVKLDKLHNIQWDKTIGGSNYDALWSIKEVTKNRYILGGYSSSGATGDKTDTSRDKRHSDYWVVNLNFKLGATDVITSSGLIINPTRHFTVYPNPAKDILHIQSNGTAIFSLTNQSGKILFTKTINGSGVINIANLSSGLYYLKNNTTGEVKKVIVSK